jgi:hypothetical protein
MTASVMIPGLRANIFSLTGARPKISLDERGLLWLENAPSAQFITSLAINRGFATPVVEEQLNVYSWLLKSYLRLDADWYTVLPRITDLLTTYFSVHLLLHNTYEEVYLKCRDRLMSSGWSQSQASPLLDLILTPGVLNWQAHNQMEDHKDLLAVTRRFVPPDGRNPVLDAGTHEQLVIDYYDSHAPINIDPDTRRYCAFAAKVAVAKEWKFVLNKLLFSAFGEAMNCLCDDLNLPAAEARLMPIQNILAISKEAQT